MTRRRKTNARPRTQFTVEDAVHVRRTRESNDNATISTVAEELNLTPAAVVAALRITIVPKDIVYYGEAILEDPTGRWDWDEAGFRLNRRQVVKLLAGRRPPTPAEKTARDQFARKHWNEAINGGEITMHLSADVLSDLGAIASAFERMRDSDVSPVDALTELVFTAYQARKKLSVPSEVGSAEGEPLEVSFEVGEDLAAVIQTHHEKTGRRLTEAEAVRAIVRSCARRFKLGSQAPRTGGKK